MAVPVAASGITEVVPMQDILVSGPVCIPRAQGSAENSFRGMRLLGRRDLVQTVVSGPPLVSGDAMVNIDVLLPSPADTRDSEGFLKASDREAPPFVLLQHQTT